MKNFTSQDLAQGLSLPTIYAEKADLVLSLLPWQKKGLQQTASGYGSKLVNPYKISYEGKLYRLYSICFSNSGSTYFTTKGKRIYLY